MIALDARDGSTTSLTVVDGSPEPIESQFKLGYGSVALLLVDRRRARCAAAARSSRRSGSTRTSSAFARSRTTSRGSRRSVETLRGYAAPCGDFQRIGRYRRARNEIEVRRRALGRGAGAASERPVVEAEPGRLVLVRRGGAPTLAVVLGIHAIRGHRVLIDALAAARRHGAGEERRHQADLLGHAAAARAARPRPIRPRGGDGRELRHLAAELGRLSVPELRRARARAGTRGHAGRDRDVIAVPGALPPAATSEWRELETATERLGHPPAPARGAALRLLAGVPARGRGAGAVRRGARPEARVEGPPHRRPPSRQRAARRRDRGAWGIRRRDRARSCGDLLGADRGGALRRPGGRARVSPASGPSSSASSTSSSRIADTVQEAQRARHLRVPVAVHAGFMPSVFRWAAGEDDWSGIVEESFGGHEGDLIRAMRRLIDVLRQLADSDEVPAETRPAPRPVARDDRSWHRSGVRPDMIRGVRAIALVGRS